MPRNHNVLFFDLIGGLFLMEEEEEGNTYGKSITSEGIPYASPVTNLRTIHVLGVLVDHPLCAHHADRGTNAIWS